MSGFKSGLVWGAIFGGIAGLMNAPKKGHETREDVKGYIDARTRDVNDVRFKVDNLSNAIQRLIHEGNLALNETSQEIQTSLKRFEEETQPRIKRVKSRISQLTEDIEKEEANFQSK